MKKRVLVTVCIALIFGACGKKKSVLVGQWLMTLPPAKTAQIEQAYQDNVAEVNKLTNAPEFLIAKYGVSDLDSIKALEIKSFKADYDMAMQPAKSFVWEFTKDGYLLSSNLKQHKTDTVYQYSIEDNNLNLILVPNKKHFTDWGFSDSTSLYIVPTAKDSLLLTRTQGRIVDSFYYVRHKK
ncbi:hypothetical protein DBR32_14510 [Taibaiella sp. KBW10]|uniref:hypothetical protein n=1 Tax=Taibaiella sp. KBW10 TaxID=2153357 RepID=UPI000F5B86EB|nr:hypothetical protein [Taibaiella sp. KBW10]RQO29793.1 hypothetical protein DBR32_14510 [Taibaiella sp. KBW10]